MSIVGVQRLSTTTQKTAVRAPDSIFEKLVAVSLLSFRFLHFHPEEVFFEVRSAKNGEEVLVFWESWSPHLIRADMRMPVLGGYETTKK